MVNLSLKTGNNEDDVNVYFPHEDIKVSKKRFQRSKYYVIETKTVEQADRLILIMHGSQTDKNVTRIKPLSFKECKARGILNTEQKKVFKQIQSILTPFYLYCWSCGNPNPAMNRKNSPLRILFFYMYPLITMLFCLVSTYVYIYIHTYTYIDTYIHIYIHAYMHA